MVATARKKKTKQALPFKRANAFQAYPEELYLEKTPGNKHYDTRVHNPPNEEWVAKILTHGVRTAVKVEKQELGDGSVRAAVVDGRQRVINALAANEVLRSKGLPPIMVPVAVTRGSADFLFEVSVICNEHRRPEDPVSQAHKIERYLSMGHSKEDAASLWGFKSTKTVENRMHLLELCEEVQRALVAGEITMTAALKLRHYSHLEQRRLLKEPKPSTPKRRRPTGKKIQRLLEVRRLPKQVKVAIQWASGEISDEDAAKEIKAFSALVEPAEDPNQAKLFNE